MLSHISIYDSFNALWYLYAGGVLWSRNSAQKDSVKSVSSVRKNLTSEFHNCSFSHREHRRTEHTKAHKDSGPSPDPSPGGKGSDHRDTPIRRISALCCPLLVSTIVLTLCDICMPEAFCGLETVRKWGLLNLWALWEKKLTSDLFACYLIESVLSFSHRRTQHKMTCERLTCRILVANPTESISSLLVAESHHVGIKQQSTSSFMVLLRLASWQ